MNYKNATQILPQELLTQIQKYIDGEFIYIPRLSENTYLFMQGYINTASDNSIRAAPSGIV